MWSSGLLQLMSSRHDRTQAFVVGIKADSACSILDGKMHKFCAMKSLTTVQARLWLSYRVKPRKISECLNPLLMFFSCDPSQACPPSKNILLEYIVFDCGILWVQAQNYLRAFGMETHKTLISHPTKILQLLHQPCTCFDTFFFIPREDGCTSQNK